MQPPGDANARELAPVVQPETIVEVDVTIDGARRRNGGNHAGG
jgi:hypothetical protein